MKTITYVNANAENAKTQTPSFGYFHLLTLVAAFLFFSLHDMSAQNASRINAGVTIEPQADVNGIITNPVTTVAFEVYSKYGQVAVSATQMMSSISVSNMTGRMFYNASAINTTEFKSPTLNVPHQVLVVRVTFANGTSAIRKVQLLN
jgi:hypothetical protein